MILENFFIILIIIAIIYLIIGSYTDFKTLEVPDFVSYSLIVVGFFLNIAFSIFYKDIGFFLKSILGFGLAFLIGMAFYYTGQWGGGDSKVLFGLGALFGLNIPMPFTLESLLNTIYNDFFIRFLANMFFLGAIYGIIWVLLMSIKNYKTAIKEFKNNLKDRKLKTIRYLSGVFVIFFLFLFNFSNFFLAFDDSSKYFLSIFLIVIYFMNYLFAYVKSIEKIAMVKEIDPEKLTEGDWIFDEIKINGKYITGPKELGITKEQIQELIRLKNQGKINKIKVKYGIPFIPSFLFGFLYTLIFNRFILF